MAISSRAKLDAQLAATKQEFDALTRRGVRVEGNVFSEIVLVKGALNVDERAGGPLLGGADGKALRAALARLGYAPEHFCCLAAVAGPVEDGVGEVPAGELLPAETFREALEALDPEAVILLDEISAYAMREAYADALAGIEQFDVAMLREGLVAHVLGRRVLALGGFEAALTSPQAKQRMWAFLKRLPPAGAPY